jgi:predicted XRE-type DNA-binding protein
MLVCFHHRNRSGPIGGWKGVRKNFARTQPKFSQKFTKSIFKLWKDFCPVFGALCWATKTIANKVEIRAKIVNLVQFIAKPRLEQRQVSAAAEVNRTLNGRNGFHHQLCWEKSSTYRFSYQNPSILHSLTMLGEGSTKERL